MADNQENRTDISTLGEFGLIDEITQGFPVFHGNTIKGVGDDAAVIDRGEDYQVVSTDLLLEGIHFDLTYTPLKHLGYKSVVVNVSDIAAMNGIPEQITVSIAISNRFSLEAIKELMHNPTQAKYTFATITDVITRLVNIKQQETENLLDYTARFKQERDVLKGKVGEEFLY